MAKNNLDQEKKSLRALSVYSLVPGVAAALKGVKGEGKLKGRCLSCGRWIRIRKNKTLHAHLTHHGADCKGSGFRPGRVGARCWLCRQYTTYVMFKDGSGVMARHGGLKGEELCENSGQVLVLGDYGKIG